MIPYLIPVKPSVPWQELQVVLDGVTFTLELQWSERDLGWYLNIMTEAGEPICMGVKVVIDWPLGGRCSDPRMPAGSLLAADTSSARRDPVLADLGARVLLTYVPAEELATL